MQTQVRVVGSGFTTFNYNGQPIAFLEVVQDTGQKAGAGLGAPFETIQPLGFNHPVEIATTRIVGAGTLTLTIRELWNQPIWYALSGLNGVGEVITDIYEALAENPAMVSCQTIIKPPGASTWRGRTFLNCVIIDIDDSETISVGAMSVARSIQIAYTHKVPFTQPASSGPLNQ